MWRRNLYARIDMAIDFLLGHGRQWRRSVLKRLIAVGVFRQHPPRPLRLPKTIPANLQSGLRLPTISIVTPSLNQGKFIERTIASVTSQQYPGLEYIVQDGGSTDGTLDFLKKHEPPSLRWFSEADSGQSNALNRGFRRTSGEIMAWLNSDDLILPGTLQYVGTFFARNPNVDVIYSHRIVIDEDDQEIGRWILPPHDYEVTRWTDFVPQETMFWRRAIWDRSGGTIDETLQFAMDWDLILRLQDIGARFRRVRTFLAAFRAHPDQKTSARMKDLGTPEMNRLRDRVHGRAVTEREGLPTIARYLIKHIILQVPYRLGLTYRR